MGDANAAALPGATPSPADDRRYQRITYSIAMGAFLASFAMNFWWPFLPLYLQTIGAPDEASALFWVGLATAVQGFGRLLTGPLWGGLSDRYGRKPMFVRALYAATATTVVAAVAQAPWVIVVSLAMQGIFSGFIPAAIALTSVSVPDQRLSRSLGVVTAGQYLGGTLGPAAGSLFVIFLGYRGAIVVSAILPSLAATWILFAVPRDITERRVKAAVSAATTTSKRTFRFSLSMFRGYPRLFWVMVTLYFGLFALNQMVRVATPVALQDMVGEDKASALAGIAFSAAGGASVLGVTIVARRMALRWDLRQSLIILTLCSAAVVPVMAITPLGPWPFLAAFMVFALLNSGSMPATNTLIAGTVGPERRGSAFGLASSAQALAFMVGPFSAAWFAGHSLPLGFVAAAVGFGLLGFMLIATLRQRAGQEATASEPAAVPSGGGR